jgi:citrate lyase subunit beta / citryl-CoA lyase
LLRRSLMPTPGNSRTKVEKARSFDLDVLMLDLEDGVPQTDSAKALARQNLKEALEAPFKAREIAIRINGPRTKWILDDIAFLANNKIDTIVLPMVYDADDVKFVERCLSNLGVSDRVGMILLIETPASVLDLPELVKASRRINGLIAGGLDYAAELHSRSILPFDASQNGLRGDEDLIYMRQRILAVARAYGLSALDAMRPGVISDMNAFRVDAERARWLGFDGLDFYHPGFISIANEVFTPTKDELDWAARIGAANAKAEDDAPSSRMVDGRVMLPQHVEIARRLQTLARTIKDRTSD